MAATLSGCCTRLRVRRRREEKWWACEGIRRFLIQFSRWRMGSEDALVLFPKLGSLLFSAGPPSPYSYAKS